MRLECGLFVSRSGLGRMSVTVDAEGSIRCRYAESVHALTLSPISKTTRGLIGFPDLRRMLESEGLEWTWTSWTLADARIQDLGQQLRSDTILFRLTRGIVNEHGC